MTSTNLRVQPAIGAIAWLVCVFACEPGWTASLLLAGPLVAVPLGLGLERSPSGRQRGPWRLAGWVALPSALLLAWSYAFEPGTTAGLLAAPWLLTTFLVAGLGIWRLVERGGGPSHELLIDAAHLFLAVGGVWTLASRFGSGLLGFHEPWVVLTGAHFHFAGFSTALLTGLIVRVRPGRLGRFASTMVLVGVPFVAIGITLGAEGVRSVELVAALWMAIAGLLVAGLHLAAWRIAPMAGVAGLALAFGMGLVITYAVGTFFGRPIVTIPEMVHWHATANVAGFALPMLLWWAIRGAPASTTPGFQLIVPALGDEVDLEAWEARPIHPETEAGPQPNDPRDRHEVVLPAAAAADAREPIAARIAAYDVFPITLGESCLRRSPVQPGDTLLLVYRLPFGLRSVFGARVSEVFDDPDRDGFTYRTIAGHPFAGEEDFVVENGPEPDSLVVALRAWSRPATPVMRVLYPIVRAMQTSGGRAAAASLAETRTSQA